MTSSGAAASSYSVPSPFTFGGVQAFLDGRTLSRISPRSIFANYQTLTVAPCDDLDPEEVHETWYLDSVKEELKEAQERATRSEATVKSLEAQLKSAHRSREDQVAVQATVIESLQKTIKAYKEAAEQQRATASPGCPVRLGEATSCLGHCCVGFSGVVGAFVACRKARD
ncbi:hypothetical protein EMIHUDRAFT_222487 [Emiliania huxleyi CCMP1516]|uniref:Uncharacterized protein n=2 Tax=Emiliania huxleyi TaxID=2903 RepID=A0A0D3KY91_EMIH1|nr:hypothetical protein EMIHUDRAFT_222487 [Emiliania huxleyi CCMP1516]EOD40726.1 hypothetical protein EMIHUDRAFT_222487 [Emiliania huxleyi CCMP1516]|eukprot:XP_005793155.1 hypothetical protein EMIHUDRAFT_222487 [Emiliania huxleyi CCMP1516]